MRQLHTMIRVGDLDKSIDFYRDVLGMRLIWRQDFSSGRFSLAFLAYGDMREHTALELTHNWDTPSYDLGEGYGHIALEVDDVTNACEEFRSKGAKVVREPGPMNAGYVELAFLEDPDGYKIELLNKHFLSLFEGAESQN